MGVDSKSRYRTPGPGAYDVRKASRQCLKSAPAVAFGGSFNKVDRQKTGPLKVLGEKEFVPGPCSYAVEAAEQARDLCERPHAFVFGKASRNDLEKLFLGKDAVAYIASRTPGPGTYEIGWQRPVFLFPTREPGVTIGGPLANVDRVQTGPLGVAYRSDTPGPGAYDETDHPRVKRAPRRRILGPKGYYSGVRSASPWSEAHSGRASTRGLESISHTDSTQGFQSNHPASQRGVEDSDGHGKGNGTREDNNWPGARPSSPFSLSPFRFVENQDHSAWQLPLLGAHPPASTPTSRSPRSVEPSRARSLPRHADGSKDRDPRKTRPSSPSANIRISWQSSSVPRPVTTFGTGTREQAGQVLAPGFKGNAARSTFGNPGPGTYRNVPSLGVQVDSTLFSSPASSFSHSARSLRSARDVAAPGPGSYGAVSSLGHQISSNCPTAPQPKFGTSVRCALEDGLVG